MTDKYWLCCGSKAVNHDDEVALHCIGFLAGDSHKYNTSEEHIARQFERLGFSKEESNKLCNKELAMEDLGSGPNVGSSKEREDVPEEMKGFTIKMNEREAALYSRGYKDGKASEVVLIEKDRNRRERELEWRQKEQHDLWNIRVRDEKIRDIHADARNQHYYFLNNLDAVVKVVIAAGIISIVIALFTS